MNGVFLNSVKVYTTNNRGYTPEEIAERTIEKIIYVGKDSHPAIIEQAMAYREAIHKVLVECLAEAQQSERITICTKLDQQGLSNIADTVRSL